MKQKDELREASSASSFILHPSSLSFSHPSSLIPHPSASRRAFQRRSRLHQLSDLRQRIRRTPIAHCKTGRWKVREERRRRVLRPDRAVQSRSDVRQQRHPFFQLLNARG